MAFYPVCQTHGQLTSLVFFASEQTRLYRNIGIVIMCIGALMTYILLAPSHLVIPGYSLGSIGLALRFVLLSFIAYNVRLIFNCRLLGIKLNPLLIHQISVFGGLLIIGWTICTATRYVISFLYLEPNLKSWVAFIMSSVLYSFIVAAIVLVKPAVCGLSRSEISKYVKSLKNFIRNPKSK